MTLIVLSGTRGAHILISWLHIGQIAEKENPFLFMKYKNQELTMSVRPDKINALYMFS